MTRNQKLILLISLFAIAVIALFSMGPIPQDQHYHNFADKRNLFGVNNFSNVVSNLPYILVGILGFFTTLRFRNYEEKFIDKREAIPFLIAFLGVFLIGLGSAYYHFTPNNDTPVWDRLPMAISFMVIFSIVISERISLKAGLFLLPLFLVLGMVSVIYWNYTEHLRQGDLRLYALVQFFPFLAIPLIIILFPAEYSGSRYLWETIFWYLIAKISEHFDWHIFELTGLFISGHTLKHLTSALATYSLVRYLKFRRAL